MIKKINIRVLSLLGIVALLAFIFNSCGNNNDGGSSQIQLNSFGPSSLMRGEQLKFIGTNLNKVTSIVLPNNVEVTTFVTKTPTLLVIDVPNETTDGKVTLKTPQGDIVTKTNLVISEPITIKSITPSTARPGDVIKIEGTYLSLVASVTFGVNKTVIDFESQSETALEVIVPDDAQTAKIVLADGQAIPNTIESASVFNVTLPAVTSISPTTVKAGANLTINGTDLDLTKDITFVGGTRILEADFVSASATQIVVKVPDNAKEGQLKLRPLSEVEVLSPALKLVAPVITNVTPDPAKNKGTLTVTGTDLDLVSTVVFGGGKTGSIQGGGSATSITVSIPADAVDGKVRFGAKSDKWDSTQTVTFVKPTISNFTSSVNTASSPSITINGTDLDLVSSVIFGGDFTSKKITVNSSTQIVVVVTPGSVSGNITLVTTNGTEVESSNSLTIVPDMPDVTSISPINFLPGMTMTISASSGMDIPFDVIFPSGTTGVVANMFVSKTSTTLKIVVPIGAKSGRIKLVNYANEIYEIPIDIKLLGADPVTDASLVFFDFNGTGKDSWWGSASIKSTDPTDNTAYAAINSSLNGWTDLFWRNSGNNFPGAKVGTDVANYVVKIDINVYAAITGGNIKIRLQDSDNGEGDFWYAIGPAAPTGQGNYTVPVTGGWTTVSIPISSFKDNYGWGSNTITDMSKIDVFGMAFDNGSSTVNIAIDNVRFEKTN
ncbi:MAG TPA: glycan-binding surface protein [Cyclobacteriaceae bacterium]